MAQHDNGRRNAGQPSGAWQQGQRDPQDFSSTQQDQSSGRYGSSYGGVGQQGGPRDPGSAPGQHNQWESSRQQQGDNWRERQGPAAGGWRPAMEERDRSWNDRGQDGSSGGYGSQGSPGGQGSFGGQAADNDYGNRGITESGNFGNYGGQGGNYGGMAGQGRPGEAFGQSYGRGGSYEPGGQSAQRFGGQGGYTHGYDARTDSTGGYGSSSFGPDQGYGSGRHGGGDWTAGSYGGRDRYLGGGRGADPTYGRSSADDYQGSRGWQGQHPSNRDRYGDNGYQGNWEQGQRGGQAYHDPDYHQWRSEQLNKLDRDYEEWRQHRYQRFSDDFDKWRADRDNQRSVGQAGAGSTASSGSGSAGAGAGTGSTGHSTAAGETSGMQAGTSRHDISSTGDKGAGKTATK